MSGAEKWEKTKRYSKHGFDKAWNTLDKLGKPVNRLSNKLGAEAFWPTTLDKENDKAARILRSFCKDGFYADIAKEEADEQMRNGVRKEDMYIPRGKQRVLQKIPEWVIRRAKGLAIFTTMRSGLWLSGSGGSGVLVARNEETGEWSPPSGIMTQTFGLGFLAGVDIYDCVVVINTYEALQSFKTVRCTIGGQATAMAGPVGIGGIVDSEVHNLSAPVWTYIKGRGLYAGLEIAGTAIIERTDENERFYGERISVTDILAGKAKRPPLSISGLMQTIKAAQGDHDVDENLLPSFGETPGDMEVQDAEKPWSVPDEEDPDPYGVKALEREGVMIREAGTRRTPNIQTFDFRPSPMSPIYSPKSRWSVESGSNARSWRHSTQSTMSVDRGTQTDESLVRRTESASSGSWVSARSSKQGTSSHRGSSLDDEPLSDGRRSPSRSPRDKLRIDSERAVPISDQTTVSGGENAATPTSPTFARARLVTIPKRVPPPLPPRSPRRPVSPPEPASPISDAGKTGISSIGSGHDEDIRTTLELGDNLQHMGPRTVTGDRSGSYQSTGEKEAEAGSATSFEYRPPTWKHSGDVSQNGAHEDTQPPRETSPGKQESPERVWLKELGGL